MIEIILELSNQVHGEAQSENSSERYYKQPPTHVILCGTGGDDMHVAANEREGFPWVLSWQYLEPFVWFYRSSKWLWR